MKKEYFAPKSRAVAFRVKASLLVGSLTGKDDELESGGISTDPKEADSKNSIWESMDED